MADGGEQLPALSGFPVLKPLVWCIGCQTGQAMSNFRVLVEDPLLYVDFCTSCEAAAGTMALYRDPAMRKDVNRRARELILSGLDPLAAQMESEAADRREEKRREFGRRELARKYLLFYTKQFNPHYLAGWVHKDVARRLERFVRDVENRKSPRLMIFMPPRHGKSLLASQELPSWVLGKHPNWEIISASYAITLPVGFSRIIKDRIDSPEYEAIFPKTKLRPDARGVEEWLTTERGRYRAVGVGGGITGTGAEILIIDDPIKDYQEAQSDLIREAAYNWYTSTARTRLSPGGGVLVIQCMTGDTAVTMADGSEKALADIRRGDVIATYAAGRVATSTVANWASQGYDHTLAITTTSGRIVRANERHPFLVQRDGEPEWVRLQDLKVGERLLVASPQGAARGKESNVPLTAARSQLFAADSAGLITKKLNGPQGTARLLLTGCPIAQRTSSIATGSHTTSIAPRSPHKAASVLSVDSHQTQRMLALTGAKSCASTTATVQAKSEGYCATTATSLLGTEKPPKSCFAPLSTYEIALDAIVSIVPSGYEEVFDIQVAGTENFIANGLVSHNTRWHDGDLSGRLLSDRALLIENGVDSDEIDDWEVVSYPALAEHDEWMYPDATIHVGPDQSEIPPDAKLLRPKEEALHPARYSSLELRRMRNTMPSVQWNALFQQNPVPESGEYFSKDMFRYYGNLPGATDEYAYFMAWDLAIGEKSSNDWTVGTVCASHYTGNIYILDMIRARMNVHGIIAAMIDMARKWPSIQVMGIEQGQIYKTMAPLVKEAMTRAKVRFSLTEELKPVTDKLMRARPLQQKMQMGFIQFPSSQPWSAMIEREMLRFPNGTNDDIVDSLAWLARMSMVISPPKPRTPKQGNKPKSWKEQLTATTSSSSFMTA